jgi:2-keto-3-deoxy-6-phosphogluconate aldolase
MDILAALKQEEAKLQKQLTGVRGAIVALGGAKTVATTRSGNRAKKTGAKRVMSPALRARLSKLAKERWAKIKSGKQKVKKAA